MSIELTPELAPEFAVTVRGYDRAQVDEYIDWLREWLSNATVRMEAAETEAGQLRDQVRRLQLRVDDLEAETSDQPPRTIAALGERVSRILELAEEGAAAVLGEAEAEAEQLLARARAEAEGISEGTAARQAEVDSRLASAAEEARQTVQEAEARASETVAGMMRDAEERAQAWEAQAQQRARELVETAEQERARILVLMAAEKAAMDAQLAGLAAQRDQVLASLSRLHQSLASTIVEVPEGGIEGPDHVPAADLDPDITAAHDVAGGGPDAAPNPAGAAGAGPGREPVRVTDEADPGRDVGYPDEAQGAPARTTGTRGAGRLWALINPAAGRDDAGVQTDPEAPVLFDREAAEDDPPPPPPSPSAFRRAGSQPDGSQRAGR
jgi:cell division septum initiation protein DivIVA